MDINSIVMIFNLLNQRLEARGATRSFIICGSSALIAQKLARASRATTDIDLLSPEIDTILKTVSLEIAHEKGLRSNWLNTDAISLIRDLPIGWEARTVEIYSSSNLIIHSIGRSDMIFSKLYAYCDRDIDFEDLIDIKPTKEEILVHVERISELDGNPNWPKLVENKMQRLLKALNYE